MNIKVSVIVPVYNSEKEIVRCAANLVNQTLEQIEIIFIDDCSTDNSYALLGQIREQFPEKVKVLKTPENSGPGGARNLGLENAAGEYIGFVDSDDIADITMYQKLYEKAVEGQYDLVDCSFVDEKSQRIFSTIPDEIIGVLDIEKRNRLISREGYIWCKLFRNSCIQEKSVRFRENCVMEDTDFIIYMYGVIQKIGRVDEVLYKHCCNKESLMETIDTAKLCRQSFETMNAIYERMRRIPYYEEIKEGTEALLTGIYLCAIINGIQSKELAEHEILSKLQELSALKRRIITGDYRNQFLAENINDDCINIMKINDKNPRELLKIMR